ncbi:hypothetical protein [Tunturiibacter gelidiferens]|uniref:Uncharacterized protein n=1 Tax=Tunturiibacter gelidiferens TaxID=3069689 RepID=A0AAU7YXJ0_9BACT
MPEDFEFPACEECNNRTSKQDTIFGFCSMLMDFNEANRSPADIARFNQHRGQIEMRWPDALPNPASGEPMFRAGHIITPSPVAVSVEMTPAMKESIEVIGIKLAHALYYREMKRIMQPTDRFFTAIHQIQRRGTENLTDYFKRVLPDLKVGNRSNIKDYGNRFAYKSGCKPDEDFFLFATQFGFGLLCWGMVLGPRAGLSASNDALIGMKWRQGGSDSMNGTALHQTAERTSKAEGEEGFSHV